MSSVQQAAPTEVSFTIRTAVSLTIVGIAIAAFAGVIGACALAGWAMSKRKPREKRSPDA